MLSFAFAVLLAIRIGPMGPYAPAREPQMAAHGSTVALTFGAGHAIYFSASRDAGKTFSAPVKVADGEILPLTRHRGPRIAIAGDTIVISAVTGRKPAEGAHAHGLPSDGDLLAWRSTDGGKSWSKGVAINDVPGAPSEGLHALAANADGSLFAVWLDKRGGKGTRLFGARSADGGATWSKNVLIYGSPEGTICECCHPSVAFGPNGQILTMWRNWLGGTRDMYLARSADGSHFSKAEKLGTGSWQLNACPMDGGGLAVSGTRTITAWRRGENVFLAEPGKAETEVGTGKDIAMAVSADRTYVIWSNGTKIESWSNGKTDVLSTAGAFPALSALPGGGVLAAWEEDGAIQMHRLP